MVSCSSGKHPELVINWHVAFSHNAFLNCFLRKLKGLCSSHSDILEPSGELKDGKGRGKLLSTYQRSLLEITHLPELSLYKPTKTQRFCNVHYLIQIAKN